MGFSCESGLEGEHAAFAAADEDLLEGDLRPLGLRTGDHVGALVIAVLGQHGLAAKITPLMPASRMQIASRSPIGQSDERRPRSDDRQPHDGCRDDPQQQA
jgi:hypothetical protein